MCSLWNNLQPVEGVQYLVEVEESKFCFIHFTILTFKTGVINILVLAGIEHLLDFPRTERKTSIVLFLLITILFGFLDISIVKI
jgi:hypothetical protein